MEEINRILDVYKIRDSKNLKIRINELYFNSNAVYERELRYRLIIRDQFGDDLSNLKVLEIGAGNGNNLLFFKRIGFRWKNIFGNELIPERADLLKENILGTNVYVGNAINLNEYIKYDIILQSTVLSSILDNNLKFQVSTKMYNLLSNSGIIISYDINYNNPLNKNIKKISRKEIKHLFPCASKIVFYKVTLAPPIGRKLFHLYFLFNLVFPFFRTHTIAIIYK